MAKKRGVKPKKVAYNKPGKTPKYSLSTRKQSEGRRSSKRG